MPPDAAPPAAGEWYYAKDGRASGPYPAGLLIAMLRGAAADPYGALVRQHPAEAWQRVDQVPELAARLNAPARPASEARPAAPSSGQALVRRRERRNWRVAGATEAAPRSNPFARHWRGELPLRRSLWINNLLLGWLVGGVLLAATAWPARHVDAAWPAFGLTALTVLAWVAFQVWLKVGTWRATAAAAQAGRARQAALARVVLVFGWLGVVLTPPIRMMPVAGAALGGSMLPVAGATVRAGGERIDFYGVVDAAAPASLARALAAAPGARLVRLQSPGGLVAEARAMARVINAHGLDTEAVGHCASACTLIFFAGRRRSLAANAGLGFHSYRSEMMTPTALLAAEAQDERDFRAAGVPVDFIQHIFATPPARIWYPSRAELEAAHFLSNGDEPFPTLPLPAPPSPAPPSPAPPVASPPMVAPAPSVVALPNVITPSNPPAPSAARRRRPG